MDDIRAAILALGKKGARAENEALRAGAEIIRREASEKAPRSRRRTQHLADHIVVGNVKKSGGIKTIEIGLEGGSEKGRFYYGRYQERGTKKMRPQPYLAPAADAKGDAAAKAMAEELKGGLGL